jgi:asparagine synthase (glutamine-hydrolysing)
VSRPGEKLHKAARVLQHASTSDLYESVMSTWRDPGVLLRQQHAPTAAPAVQLPGADPVRLLQLLDQRTYLPDDLLVKVDRAAMSVSLETRVPMLSAAVVAHSWSMPTSALLARGRAKAPLRELLLRRLPAELIDRPKQGFGVPLGEWLRGPLRNWSHDLLTPAALDRSGVFRPEPLVQLLSQHDAGLADNSALLWPVLMFQSWSQSES